MFFDNSIAHRPWSAATQDGKLSTTGAALTIGAEAYAPLSWISLGQTQSRAQAYPGDKRNGDAAYPVTANDRVNGLVHR